MTYSYNNSLLGDYLTPSGDYLVIENPTLTGIPTSPTASSGTNTSQIATTSFVRTEITNLSVLGHTHTSSDITNFNTSVSGLLPTISNSGNNRILTSDGTPTGINAESNLTFDGRILELECVCSSGDAGFVGVGDGNIVNFRANQFFNNSVEPPRLIFRRTRGSEAAPQVANSGDGIFAIRGETIDYSGNIAILGGLRMEVVEPASPTGLNPATKIFLRTSSGGDNLLDKALTLNSDGTLVNTGPIKVNDTLVSLEGHTHTSSGITDFNSSVSGLLPTIANSGNNRILTSDGTSTGINAESYLKFNDLTSSLQLIYDSSVGHTGASALINLEAYDNTEPTTGGRLQFIRNRGTFTSQSGVINGDTLSSIRTFTKDSSNINSIVSRILVQAEGATTGLNLYTPTRMSLHTSSGPAQLDNNLTLYSNGQLSHNGYMTIDDGLSAPTNVYNHAGSLSGNIAINYDYDRQIQYFSINGTTNFTKGTGWTTGTKSVDIVVAITVFATTTIAFDSNFVIEWYNPLPIFTANTTINGITAGRYLVLLRSIGNYVQGHYIGNVTNAY